MTPGLRIVGRQKNKIDDSKSYDDDDDDDGAIF